MGLVVTPQRRGEIYLFVFLYFFYFFYLFIYFLGIFLTFSTRAQSRPVNRFLCKIAQKTWFYATYALLGVTLAIRNFFTPFSPKNPNFRGLVMYFQCATPRRASKRKFGRFSSSMAQIAQLRTYYRNLRLKMPKIP